jgi:hypothetical protein
MHIFNCEMDLALTYSMRKPEIARNCAVRAFFAALAMERPDLAYRANSLLAAIGAV